jgi:signal transduction histidine kinase
MLGKSKTPPAFAFGLSARLLLLTIGFVMLAEVLIYTPSIGRFRAVYLEERLAAGHLAILALEATPDHMVSQELTIELLKHVEAFTVALTKPGAGKLMLMDLPPKHIDASFDLREAGFFVLIRDAFAALLAKPGRVIRVVGVSSKDPNILVEVVLNEGPMRDEMFAFSQRILALSLVISLFTAALVFLSLHWMMVRPMRHITASMSAFRKDPEDASRVVRPSNRRDEIGFAEHELAAMQEGLRASLQQKTRLAALGVAVTKINHDLRNILATARLVSDRLDLSDDPEVKRVTPTLMSAIDRAVNLCAQTLSFTREGPPALELTRFDLRALVADVGAALPETVNGQPVWNSLLQGGLEVEADREHLFRVLSNLGQNAIEAGASRVEVSAEQMDGRVRVTVSDNGPGLPPRAHQQLFQPFTGSARPGGTGLGLAIARDLVRAHGGEIRLEHSTADGTSFRIELPVRQMET